MKYQIPKDNKLIFVVIVITLFLSSFRAYAVCSGVFMQADAIEKCLDSEEQIIPSASGGQPRAWQGSRNLTVTRPNSPVKEVSQTVNLWINFAFDSAELAPDARITLDELAKALRGARLLGNKFVLTGHTDAVGTADYNQALSERRANAVKAYLVSQGQVQTDRLFAEGVGYSKPMNADDARAAENRRVEVKIKP